MSLTGYFCKFGGNSITGDKWQWRQVAVSEGNFVYWEVDTKKHSFMLVGGEVTEITADTDSKLFKRLGATRVEPRPAAADGITKCAFFRITPPNKDQDAKSEYFFMVDHLAVRKWVENLRAVATGRPIPTATPTPTVTIAPTPAVTIAPVTPTPSLDDTDHSYPSLAPDPVYPNYDPPQPPPSNPTTPPPLKAPPSAPPPAVPPGRPASGPFSMDAKYGPRPGSQILSNSGRPGSQGYSTSPPGPTGNRPLSQGPPSRGVMVYPMPATTRPPTGIVQLSGATPESSPRDYNGSSQPPSQPPPSQPPSLPPPSLPPPSQPPPAQPPGSRPPTARPPDPTSRPHSTSKDDFQVPSRTAPTPQKVASGRPLSQGPPSKAIVSKNSQPGPLTKSNSGSTRPLPPQPTKAKSVPHIVAQPQPTDTTQPAQDASTPDQQIQPEPGAGPQDGRGRGPAGRGRAPPGLNASRGRGVPPGGRAGPPPRGRARGIPPGGRAGPPPRGRARGRAGPPPRGRTGPPPRGRAQPRPAAPPEPVAYDQGYGYDPAAEPVADPGQYPSEYTEAPASDAGAAVVQPSTTEPAATDSSGDFDLSELDNIGADFDFGDADLGFGNQTMMSGLNQIDELDAVLDL